MTAFSLYLGFVLIPSLGKLAIALGVVSVPLSCIYMCYLSDNAGEKTFGRALKKVAWVIGILFLMGAVLPNAKQMALITGGSYLANIDSVQALPENTAKLLNAYIENSLEQFSEEKTEGGQ